VDMAMNGDDMGCWCFLGNPDGKADSFSRKLGALATLSSLPSPSVASA
jgi:hypothetical protein